MNLIEAMAFEQIRTLVQQALKTKLNPSAGDSGPYGPYIVQTYPDSIVYEWQGKNYKCDFTCAMVNNDMACTLGDAVEVMVSYEPIADANDPEEDATDASEATIESEFVPLVETALRNNTTQIKVVKPGWGSTGYYSKKLLERDGPKVFTKGTKMYWDHPTITEAQERPERSLRDLAGEFTTDARWLDKGPAGPGLYANAKIFEAFAPHVESMAEHIGVSLRASGTAKQGEAEGKKGRIIESIVSAKSVDFVTQPGAGGQIVQLFESARASEPQEDDMDEAKVQEMIEAATKPLYDQLTAVTAERDRLVEGQLMAEGAGLITTQVNASALPAITKARMIESLKPKTPIKEGKVDADALKTLIETALKDESEYLSKVTGSPIRGMNSTPVDASEAEREKATEKLPDVFQRLGLSESAAKVATAGR